jgi:tetratricopeptide (TPR) repeat protein
MLATSGKRMMKTSPCPRKLGNAQFAKSILLNCLLANRSLPNAAPAEAASVNLLQFYCAADGNTTTRKQERIGPERWRPLVSAVTRQYNRADGVRFADSLSPRFRHIKPRYKRWTSALREIPVRSLQLFDAAVILVLVSALGLCGCGAKQPPRASADYGSFGQPPSDEECQRFAQSLQEAIAAKNVAQADRQISYDAIFEHAMTGIEASKQLRAEVKSAVMKSIGEGNSIAAQVCSVLPSGVTYRFLTVRTKDGQKCALFRLMGESTGLNYHEFVLVKQPDDQVRAVDVYLATSGEYLSETYRRGFVCAAAAESSAGLSRLSPPEVEFVQHYSDVQQIGSLVQQDKFEDALDLYAQLPASLKTLKSMLLMQIRAAGSLNDRRYDKAIEDFRKNYPNDPCLDLILIDSYRMHNETAMALKAIDKVEQSFGPDPYLNVLRATFYLKEHRYDEAHEAGRKAIEKELDLEQGYWVEVEALLAQQKYEQATAVLRVLKDERHRSIARVRGLDGYAGLAKSPAYAAWTKQGHSP